MPFTTGTIMSDNRIPPTCSLLLFMEPLLPLAAGLQTDVSLFIGIVFAALNWSFVRRFRAPMPTFWQSARRLLAQAVWMGASVAVGLLLLGRFLYTDGGRACLDWAKLPALIALPAFAVFALGVLRLGALVIDWRVFRGDGPRQ